MFPDVPLFPAWSVQEESFLSDKHRVIIRSVVRVLGKNPKDRRKKAWFQHLVVTYHHSKDLRAHIQFCHQFEQIGVGGETFSYETGQPISLWDNCQFSWKEVYINQFNSKS